MKTIALITGASSGLGLEFAKLFAKDGHDTILVARSENKLKELADELKNQHGTNSYVFAKDLSREEDVESLINSIKEQNLKVEFLVNNAGFGDFSLFHEADYHKLDQMMNLNIKALTRLSYVFGKEMAERKSGRILNIASTAAFQPGPTMAVYYASKAYVLSLSEALHNELKDFGVSVTTFCPGATESGFQSAADMHESRLVKNKKLPTAKEVAKVGYNHMKKGSLTVIPGFMNALMAFSIRFTPRAWVLPIVRYMQNPK